MVSKQFNAKSIHYLLPIYKLLHTCKNYLPVMCLFLLLGLKSQAQCVTSNANVLATVEKEINGSQTQKYVKVVWHVVRRTNKTMDLPVAYYESLINSVRGIYDPLNIKLRSCHYDNTNQTEIKFVDSDFLYSSTDAEHICRFNTYCTADVLNVFLVESGAESGVAEMRSNLCFISVSSSSAACVPIMVHEIGHCFGLFHISGGRDQAMQSGTTSGGSTSVHNWKCDKQGTNFLGALNFFPQCNGTVVERRYPIEKMDGSNGATSGDFVVDTKADIEFPMTLCQQSKPYESCVSSSNSCDNVLDGDGAKDPDCVKLKPDWYNYMHTGAGTCIPSCLDHFTNGQVSRMHGVISTFLGNLTSSQEPNATQLCNICYNGGNFECCEESKVPLTNIIVTQNTTLAANRVHGKVIVAPGATLTINKYIEFTPLSSIVVEKNGKLIVDAGGQLNKCPVGTKWKGVVNFGEVILRNGAILGDAVVGISNDNGLISIINSRISQCNIGIQQLKQNTNSNVVSSSTFDNCVTAIDIKDNKYFAINSCAFSACSNGINGDNSIINVTNCDINATYGITLTSTLPSLSGSSIVSNRFLNNTSPPGQDNYGDIAISIEGGANLIPHTIQGNFFGNDGTGISNRGITTYDCNNNDFYCAKGISTWDNGNDKSQKVSKCSFNSATHGGEAIGKNDTEYNDNCFVYTQQAHLSINALSSINADQGDGGVGSTEAGNCFTGSFSQNIMADGSSYPFDYHIWKNTPAASCKDPKAGLTNYTVWSLLKDADEASTSNTCGSNQWPTTLPPSYRNCVIPEGLAAQKAMYAALRKEYFRIQSSTAYTPKFKAYLLNRILRCIKLLTGTMVKQLVAEQNTSSAIAYLDSIPSLDHKILAYALVLDHSEVAAARSYLTAIPYSTQEAIDFKTVQHIYLDYLTDRAAYVLSPADRSTLYQVGIKHNEYSSFARSIFYILTGTRIMPDLSRITNVVDAPQPRSATETLEPIGITISPNPTDGTMLKVDISGSESHGNLAASMYDMYGKLIVSASVSIGQNAIELHNAAAGVYIMKISDGDQVIKLQKIIVTR